MSQNCCQCLGENVWNRRNDMAFAYKKAKRKPTATHKQMKMRWKWNEDNHGVLVIGWKWYSGINQESTLIKAMMLGFRSDYVQMKHKHDYPKKIRKSP